MFQKHHLTIKHHILSTSYDNLSSFLFQIYPKPSEHVHTFERVVATIIRLIQVYANNIIFTLKNKSFFR